MAVPTITLDMPRVTRLGNTQFGVLSGQVAISSYDTAHPAVAAITGKFKDTVLLRVLSGAVSTLGFWVAWDRATLSFKAYTSAGTVPVEVANTTNVGNVDFVAIGHLGL